MTGYRDSVIGWDEAYTTMLARLNKAMPGDGPLGALAFAEEARVSSGSDDYLPEWIEPYVSVAMGLLPGAGVEGTDAAPQAYSSPLRPAILRAIQLGFTEGYFAGKDDG